MRLRPVWLLAFIGLLAVPAYAQRAPSNQDPCATLPRQSAAINLSSATDTQLVAAVTGANVYVCNYFVNQVAGTGSFAFEYGTGTNCGTGKTVLMGPSYASTVANTVTNVSAGAAESTQVMAPMSQALCVASTGTIQQSGWVSYVQTANPLATTGADPCANLPKKSVPINQSTATTTQLVGLVAGSPIYACGFVLNQVNGTGTLGFEYGTGSNCATGATALTGVISPAATASGVTTVSMPSVRSRGSQFVAPAGQELCAVSTGTIQQSGELSYVQTGDSNVINQQDPCGTYLKQSASFSFSSATTTQIIPATTGGRQAYVCGYYINDAGRATTANTFQFEYGTKASTDCDTGATALTGPFTGSLTAGAATAIGPVQGSATHIVVPTGQQMCGVTTQSSTVTGYVNYVIR